MATKKTVRPKIKDKLPEKLPPVEPDTKETFPLTPTDEDIQSFAKLKEGDLKEEVLTGLKAGRAQDTHPSAKEEEHPTPEEVIEAVVKTLDERTATEDDWGKEVQPDTKTEAETGKHYEEGTIDDDLNVHPKAKEEAQQEDITAGTHAVGPTAKEAQPDKYPSHAGQKEEQPFLFGEADQILNALETELSEWKDRKQKLWSSKLTIEDKIVAAKDRICSLASAILATKKHAPMTEDPAVPEQIGETAVKVVEGLRPDTVKTDELTDPGTPELTAEEDTTSSVEPLEKTPELSGELAVTFRTQSQPLPEVLFLGDIITTSWNTGPYRVEEIVGPYTAVTKEGDDIPAPEHWSIKCSEAGAKRNKDGKLPKNHEYAYINLVVAVGNRFLSVHSESADEIFLVGKKIEKKTDAPQSEAPAEEDLDL